MKFAWIPGLPGVSPTILPPNIAGTFLMQLDAQPTAQAHEIIQGADESQEPNNHIAW